METTPPKIDFQRFAALLKAHRGTKGLRLVAAEIGGVSASTLSRVEQGGVPDLETYLRLCRWLGVSSDDLSPMDANHSIMNTSTGSDKPTPELIEAHFRAEKVLPPETIDALSNMIRQAYKWADAQGLGKKSSI
jgi:transcriptional regulator with XRE-family HTH domain